MTNKDPLEGYVFVFTGEMSIPRDEAKNRVVLLGARVTTAVSSKTTHLVLGVDPGPTKISKARELNIVMVDEEEFCDILKKNECKMDYIINTNKEDVKSLKEDVKSLKKDNETPELQKEDAKSLKKETPQKRRMQMKIKHKTEIESEEKYTDSAEFNHEFTNINEKPWAEKYRPSSRSELIGNNSVIDQLNDFINGKSTFKAALLSGSPGVGKTTAAHLLCKISGIEAIEFNASDLRNKKNIAEHIGGIINNLLVSKGLKINKRILIMDEVDGMTSDRGGIPELVNIIKKTKVPIICICNDRTHLKMRTLANHCLDLKFRKLDPRTILPRIKQILEKENKQLNDGILNEIILNCNGDMRFVLNTIQNLVCRDIIDLHFINKMLVKKNISKGSFELAAEIFQKKSIEEKNSLYFEDYEILPLFVHENYIKCNFKSLKELLISADSISFSDLQDAKIHGSEQEWSLLPYHAFFSCIYPTHNKTLTSRIDFPMYLGQNSKLQKHGRILAEISSHFRGGVSKSNIRNYLGEIIYKKFMCELQNGNIGACIEMLLDTDLAKEDIINLGELLNDDLFGKVSTKNKTALTREYKKLDRHLPYTIYTSNDIEEENSDD